MDKKKSKKRNNIQKSSKNNTKKRVTPKIELSKPNIKNNKIKIFLNKLDPFVILGTMVAFFTILFIISFILLFSYSKRLSNLDKKLENSFSKSEYVNPKTVFIGDSITARYNLDKFFNDNSYINNGKEGDCTETLLKRLQSGVYDYNPKRVVLLIGTNDLPLDMSKEETISNIESVLVNIKANNKYTEIFTLSILPVIESDNDEKKFRTNEEIDELNKMIKELCNRLDVSYIDVNSKLLKDGELNKDYTKDGLHINDKGYQQLTNVLKKYLK